MPATFTPLARIQTGGGEVLKALRSDEPGFTGLGEAYFSKVNPGSVRAWKLHTEMTVNMVVPVGHMRVVVADGVDEHGDPADATFSVYDLGPDHDYGRLTIEPGTWYGFQGGADGGMVCNLADRLHDPGEGRARDIDDFDWSW